MHSLHKVNPETIEIKDKKLRFEAFGDNQKEAVVISTFCELLLGALNDFTLKILLGAAAVALIVAIVTSDKEEIKYSWLEGFAIFVAVAVCSTVSAVNDY